MVDALWELTPPIFLGTLLAIVAIVLLMNKQAKLLRGPRRLAAALFAPKRRWRGCKVGRKAAGCKAGCACPKCRDLGPRMWPRPSRIPPAPKQQFKQPPVRQESYAAAPTCGAK